MAEEIKKTETNPQAPADGKAPVVVPVVVPKVEVTPTPAGLENFTVEKLKEFYSKSPQMFKDAGIIKEEVKPEVKVEPVKPEVKVETVQPQSAAPVVLDGVEIKLPEDVPVNRDAVAAYLLHAKENGLSPKQVQAEIDFMTNRSREAVKLARTQQPDPEEERRKQDAANVAVLKADKTFGANYEENMEIARQAAAKFADPELLERLKTSDPVLVRHFLKVGKADSEDRTRGAPNRNGREGEDEARQRAKGLRARFPNSPTMRVDGEDNPNQ